MTEDTIYKVISLADAKNRVQVPLTDAQKVKVNETVTKFIEYLKKANS